MIYSFFANGFEEIEAITPVDLLRRLGKEVKIVGVNGMTLTGANGITVEADISESEAVLDSKLEMIILPGGKKGTDALRESTFVSAAIDFCVENNIFIGAICAAPSALGLKGLLKGKKATCYPGFEKYLDGAIISDDYVVVDGKFITARGAGVSTEFALTLAEQLCGKEASDKIYSAIQCSF